MIARVMLLPALTPVADQAVDIASTFSGPEGCAPSRALAMERIQSKGMARRTRFLRTRSIESQPARLIPFGQSRRVCFMSDALGRHEIAKQHSRRGFSKLRSRWLLMKPRQYDISLSNHRAWRTSGGLLSCRLSFAREATGAWSP